MIEQLKVDKRGREKKNIIWEVQKMGGGYPVESIYVPQVIEEKKIKICEK